MGPFGGVSAVLSGRNELMVDVLGGQEFTQQFGAFVVHAEMTALSALGRAHGHGVLTEFLAQFRGCGEGGLLGDLGEQISSESKGRRGRIRCHGESSGGNTFLHSSLSAQDLVGRLRREKMAVDAGQRSLRFVAHWARWSRPRHQNHRNTVANDI
jgi:hypothetical protein